VRVTMVMSSKPNSNELHLNWSADEYSKDASLQSTYAVGQKFQRITQTEFRFCLNFPGPWRVQSHTVNEDSSVTVVLVKHKRIRKPSSAGSGFFCQ
jgi:hypothetical protein